MEKKSTSDYRPSKKKMKTTSVQPPTPVPSPPVSPLRDPEISGDFYLVAEPVGRELLEEITTSNFLSGYDNMIDEEDRLIIIHRILDAYDLLWSDYIAGHREYMAKSLGASLGLDWRVVYRTILNHRY